jgi:hypothetical protein
MVKTFPEPVATGRLPTIPPAPPVQSTFAAAALKLSAALFPYWKLKELLG